MHHSLQLVTMMLTEMEASLVDVKWKLKWGKALQNVQVAVTKQRAATQPMQTRP